MIAAEHSRLLVFGASAHVGGPLARFVADAHPSVSLRLATSDRRKAEQLRRSFPKAEVVIASYFDVDSLTAALQGVSGVFVITPDFFDEITAMNRLVKAVRRAGGVRSIVRICADTPGMSLDTMPRELYFMGPGPAHQHFEAQLLLDASGLPVTFLNSLGYYMDDFLIHFGPALKLRRKLIIPYERRMCFTDTRDLGEAAARLLLDDDPQQHAGQYYEFNSGEPALTFRETAAMITEVTGVPIAYDPTPATFLEVVGPVIRQITGNERAADYFVTNWAMERDHQAGWVGSAFGERVLGRKPRTLRAWMEEHKHQLLADS